jgi:hypothetical protein
MKIKPLRRKVPDTTKMYPAEPVEGPMTSAQAKAAAAPETSQASNPGRVPAIALGKLRARAAAAAHRDPAIPPAIPAVDGAANNYEGFSERRSDGARFLVLIA